MSKSSLSLLVNQSYFGLTSRLLLETKTKSETIWLGSKENLLISHNSKGNVYCTNLISKCHSALLADSNEKAVKTFFTPNSLFLATKPKFSEFLNFYLISLISLQNNSCPKEPILQNLRVTLKNLKEFSISSYKIIVEVDENLQIWDIETQELLRTFPLNPLIMCQYTKESIVYWQVGNTETRFQILSINEEKNLTFSIESNKTLCFCQIIDEDLVLAFNTTGLIAVNLKSFKCRIVSQSAPKTIFPFEETENFVAIFYDGTGIIGLCSEKLGFEEFGECLICEIRNEIIVFGKNGKVGLLTSGKIQVLGQCVQEVEQVCCNLETGEIFMACQGNYFIL